MIFIFITLSNLNAKETKLHYKENLLKELYNAKTPVKKLEFYNQLSNLYLKTSNYDSSLIFANKAIHFAIKENLKKGIAESYSNLAKLNLKSFQFKEAKRNFEKGLEFATNMNECSNIAENLLGIANAFSGMQDFSNAEKNFQLAISKFKECKDYLGECEAYISYGMMFQKDGRDADAMITFKKALNIAKQQSDDSKISTIYSLIGNIHVIKSNFKDAFSCFQESQKINEGNNDNYGLIRDNLNFGILYLNLYTMDDALKYFEIALKSANKLGDESLGKILYNKGIATEKSSGAYNPKKELKNFMKR